jgi:hypothetical protein
MVFTNRTGYGNLYLPELAAEKATCAIGTQDPRRLYPIEPVGCGLCVFRTMDSSCLSDAGLFRTPLPRLWDHTCNESFARRSMAGKSFSESCRHNSCALSGFPVGGTSTCHISFNLLSRCTTGISNIGHSGLRNDPDPLALSTSLGERHDHFLS